MAVALLPLSVGSAMTPYPVTNRMDEPVQDAARQMRDRFVGAVVVVDGVDRVAGVLTDRDVVALVADGRDPRSTAIGDVCAQLVPTVRLDDDIGRAAQLMFTHGVRLLPVVDRGSLVGLVTLTDLAAVLGESWTFAVARAAAPTW